MPGRFGSVRVRTTLVAATAVGVAMVLGAWALVAILQRSLTEGVQSALELRLQGVVALAKLGTLGSQPSLLGQPIALVQMVDASGRVTAASSLLQDRPAIGPFRDPGTTIPAWTARLTTDDEQYRIVGTTTSTPAGPVTIYAAASLEAASDSVTRVKVALVIGLPILLLIVAAACWWIVGRALRPVEAIRTEVAAIGSGRLDQRVPEPPVDDEIGRLARTMNEMLDRLQNASDRQRRFIADASHELRSPIASLRTQIEVQQTYSDNGGGLKDPLSSQLAEVGRMERLVSDLLTLARADERELAARVDRVSLREVVLEEAERSVGVGRVRVDTSGVRPVTVLGDPKGLARVVRQPHRERREARAEPHRGDTRRRRGPCPAPGRGRRPRDTGGSAGTGLPEVHAAGRESRPRRGRSGPRPGHRSRNRRRPRRPDRYRGSGNRSLLRSQTAAPGSHSALLRLTDRRRSKSGTRISVLCPGHAIPGPGVTQ
jgi:signal transduction histidine kinase